MGIPLETMIFVMFLGICCAAFSAYFHKKFIGDVVRDLIEVKAHSESTAVSLEELGYTMVGKAVLAHSLKKTGSLRRFVEAVGEEEEEETEESLFFGKKKASAVKYYLPYEKYEEAGHRYDDKGTTFAAVVICTVVFAVVALVCTAVIPLLQNLALGVPDSFKLDANAVGEVTESVTTQSGEDVARRAEEEERRAAEDKAAKEEQQKVLSELYGENG